MKGSSPQPFKEHGKGRFWYGWGSVGRRRRIDPKTTARWSIWAEAKHFLEHGGIRWKSLCNGVVRTRRDFQVGGKKGTVIQTPHSSLPGFWVVPPRCVHEDLTTTYRKTCEDRCGLSGKEPSQCTPGSPFSFFPSAEYRLANGNRWKVEIEETMVPRPRQWGLGQLNHGAQWKANNGTLHTGIGRKNVLSISSLEVLSIVRSTPKRILPAGWKRRVHLIFWRKSLWKIRFPKCLA